MCTSFQSVTQKVPSLFFRVQARCSAASSNGSSSRFTHTPRTGVCLEAAGGCWSALEPRSRGARVEQTRSTVAVGGRGSDQTSSCLEALPAPPRPPRPSRRSEGRAQSRRPGTSTAPDGTRRVWLCRECRRLIVHFNYLLWLRVKGMLRPARY